MSLKELKERINLYSDGAEDYSKFSDFRRYVLDRAKEEINQYTDIVIDYLTIKRGKKVTGIKFFIQTKSWNDRKDTEAQNHKKLQEPRRKQPRAITPIGEEIERTYNVICRIIATLKTTDKLDEKGLLELTIQQENVIGSDMDTFKMFDVTVPDIVRKIRRRFQKMTYENREPYEEQLIKLESVENSMHNLYTDLESRVKQAKANQNG